MTSGSHASAAARRRALGRCVALACVAASAVACGGDDGAGTVRVAAAASLTDVVEALDDALADADDPLDVQADLGGSSVLAGQIIDGSPADVFLSADEATMDRVVEADLAAGDVLTFATNHLVIAVPAGNPAGVRSLDDVADEALVVGRCADEVPCGRLALAELAESGIADEADTEEADARTLLRKVEAGELDVALVYATDAASPDAGVETVADDRLDQRNRYQAVRIADGDEEAAERFLALLGGAPGRALLAGLGFGPA